MPGVSAKILTERSRVILAAAISTGTIKLGLLGYVMVDVETAGLTKPLNTKQRGGAPFLRGALVVSELANGSGNSYSPINLIKTFLEPKAQAAFGNSVWKNAAKRMCTKYPDVAVSVNSIWGSMGKEPLQANIPLQQIMDPVIQPLLDLLCGGDKTFASSSLPEEWKQLLNGIDDGIIKWMKKIDFNEPTEINRLRKQALVCFISTRGFMPVLKGEIEKLCSKIQVDSKRLIAYLNSYFTSERAQTFLIDTLLSFMPDDADKLDKKIREDLTGRKKAQELVSNSGAAKPSGRGSSYSIKSLKNTKRQMPLGTTASTNSSRVKLDQANTEKEIQRNKFFRSIINQIKFEKIVNDVKTKVNLAIFDQLLFQKMKELAANLSPKAYENFEADPFRKCLEWVNEYFEPRVTNPEIRQKKKEVIEAVESAQQLSLTEATRSTPTSTTSLPTSSTSTTSDASSFVIPPFPTEDDLSDENNE